MSRGLRPTAEATGRQCCDRVEKALMGVQPNFSFPALARFADNLCRARERAGLDQQDAAEKASISAFRLDRIEAGESVPPLDIGVNLAVAYSTSLGELLAGIIWRPPADDGPLRGEYVVAEEPAPAPQERRSGAS